MVKTVSSKMTLQRVAVCLPESSCVCDSAGLLQQNPDRYDCVALILYRNRAHLIKWPQKYHQIGNASVFFKSVSSNWYFSFPIAARSATVDQEFRTGMIVEVQCQHRVVHRSRPSPSSKNHLCVRMCTCGIIAHLQFDDLSRLKSSCRD